MTYRNERHPTSTPLLETAAPGAAASAALAVPRLRSLPARKLHLWRDRWMYLLMLPGLIYFVVFRYVPLLGNIIAFQDYSPFLGFDSPFVGLANFARLFTDP